jgi:Signal peptidase (SPase) II
MGPRWLGLGLLGLALAACADGASKALATAGLDAGAPAWLIPSVLGLERVMHPERLTGHGIATAAAVAAVLAPVIVTGVAQLPPRQRSAAALLIGVALGGVLANGAERILRGGVTDWILLHVPGFENLIGNLADLAILAGGIPVMVMAVLGLLRLAAGAHLTD